MATGGLQILLIGDVQGRGVRPAVARFADECGLTGQVGNTRAGLVIELFGEKSAIEFFAERLGRRLPAGCVVSQRVDTDRAFESRESFVIAEDADDARLQAWVPRDLGLCETCRTELSEPRNRRQRYALIGCAACGPRYSVIKTMPFDRDRTTMRDFTMCSACGSEYASASNRRFHAQTNCCPQCGPNVWVEDPAGKVISRGAEAIRWAADAIRRRQIVALRGIGGYQLVCDATSSSAVRRLRQRKQRPGRPFAVLARSLQQVELLAELSQRERELLESEANPIVLLQAKPDYGLARSVAPGVSTIGVMLPGSGLHEMLMAECGWPLVCTSANREGEPIEFEPQGARDRLQGIADLFLQHDREITRPIDDSVVRVIAGNAVTIRLARGLAPLPLPLDSNESVIATGGHLKAAVAIANSGQCVLGPHIGDLESTATRARYVEQLRELAALYDVQAARYVQDLHPDYFSAFAIHEPGTPAHDQPSIAVQHHRAHVVAGMVEHDLIGRKVLGVAWDGVGYGDDGAPWGGEFLVIDEQLQSQRVARFRPLALIGGDMAAREPWRSALGALHQTACSGELIEDILNGIDVTVLNNARRLLTTRAGCIETSSVGRLFDAVAGIALGLTHVDYEAQAAMMLESIADPADFEAYPLTISDGTLVEIDWRPMLHAIAQDRVAGLDPGAISMRFHRTMADAICQMAERIPDLPIVLSGGVFQNRILTELVVSRIRDRGRLRLPGEIPPGDGGLAVGQLAIALHVARHSSPAT